MSAAGAAVVLAIANAIKASGVVVHVDSANFQSILHKIDKPLIVYAEGGLFKSNYQYLVSYKGLAFYTKASAPILLPAGAETIVTKNIWIPG